MKKFLLFTIIFLFTTPIVTYGQSNSWNGITPLYSTRADVEEQLGKPKECNVLGWCEYKTNNEKVAFSYIEFRCEDGWNVPKDTVISIRTFPYSLLNRSFEELNLERIRFTYSVDDAFYGTWTDGKNGISYYFSNVDKELIFIQYFPQKSDNNLRCNGFPPFSPEGFYFPAETIRFYNPSINKRENLYRQIASLDNLYQALKSSGTNVYKAYVLVYFDNKLPFKEYKARLSSLKNFVFEKRKYSREDLIFIEGGLKEESQMELYLLPKDYKPPAPNPTLPTVYEKAIKLKTLTNYPFFMN